MTSAVLAAVEFQRPGGAPLLLAQQIDESAAVTEQPAALGLAHRNRGELADQPRSRG
jgi:hypothetical protein